MEKHIETGSNQMSYNEVLVQLFTLQRHNVCTSKESIAWMLKRHVD